VQILDSLVFEGSVGMLMGFSTAGSPHCMLPDSWIVECTYGPVVDARRGQWASGNSRTVRGKLRLLTSSLLPSPVII
jgi:hypothetical protein